MKYVLEIRPSIKLILSSISNLINNKIFKILQFLFWKNIFKTKRRHKFAMFIKENFGKQMKKTGNIGFRVNGEITSTERIY